MDSAFVAIDLGASSTRCISNSSQLLTVPNNMCMLDMDTVVDQEVIGDSILDNLEVYITKEDNKCRIKRYTGEVTEILPAHVVIGQMAERYSSVQTTPDANMAKRFQPINYISILTGVALTKLKDSLDDQIELYLAIPPSQLTKEAREAMSEALVGKYKVEFAKFAGGQVVEFTITEVNLEAESSLAVMSYLFNTKLAYRPENRKYAGENKILLSMDIGASTTDLVIVKGGVFMENTGKTIKVGGNLVRDKLADKLTSRFDDEPVSKQLAEDALIEGRVKRGSLTLDASKEVNESKQEVADIIINEMTNYFIEKGYPISAIDAIVVSGGGSIASQYVNKDGEIVPASKPMSEIISDKLTKLSPGTVVESHGSNPRTANIEGLYIKVAAIHKKRERDKAKANAN